MDNNFFKYSYKTKTKESLSIAVYNTGKQKCEAGYSWGPALRDHYLIHYIISGRGTYVCGDEIHRLQAGDLFIVYPNQIVSYSADREDPWQYCWVGFNGTEAQRLIDVTQQSFFEGIRFAREGQRLSDISAAVQKYVEDNGYSVVREYVGHGIGRKMHESPEVPNFGAPGHGPRLLRGMTIAVEPMVNAGGAAVRVMPDGWTVRTQDGSLAAHYENTILITDGEAELLTLPEI